MLGPGLAATPSLTLGIRYATRTLCVWFRIVHEANNPLRKGQGDARVIEGTLDVHRHIVLNSSGSRDLRPVPETH